MKYEEEPGTPWWVLALILVVAIIITIVIYNHSSKNGDPDCQQDYNGCVR